MKRLVFLFGLFCFATFLAQAQTPTKIKLRFKDETRDPKKAQQVDLDATLSLDDAARRLVVTPKNRPGRELKYDDVEKIIIELDSHAGNIGFGAGLLGLVVGGMALGGHVAAAVDNPIKANHVVYIEPRGGDASAATGSKPAALMLVLGKDEAPAGLQRLKAAFGDRIVLPAFEEAPEQLDKKLYKSSGDLQVRGHAQEHRLPELRPDKALVVVASPLGGSFQPVEKNKWTPFYATILADDQLVAVNSPGSYSFFYLDPGEYLLLSEAMVGKRLQNVTGLRIKVEAGKDYYLMQTIYIGGGIKSFLTRHSKEVVMQEVSELLWAEWRVKE